MKKHMNPQCFITGSFFELQVLILQFFRSEREKNFNLYVDVLNSSMKHIFALNHFNYARWLSLHVDDLLKLVYKCSDIYKEFCNGHFVISKIESPFSSIAIDQAREQNNAIIRRVGGAVGLLSQAGHGCSSTAMENSRSRSG